MPFGESSVSIQITLARDARTNNACIETAKGDCEVTLPCRGLMPVHAVLPVNVPSRSCESHAHAFRPCARFAPADERNYTPPTDAGECFIEHPDLLVSESGEVVW